jgi:hypothetical protein
MEGMVEDFGDIPASEQFAIMGTMEKTWVTMGDLKVREAHQKANWQTVKTNEPFLVKGQNLMYPGDTSMGASLDNTSGCRCHAAYL